MPCTVTTMTMSMDRPQSPDTDTDTEGTDPGHQPSGRSTDSSSAQLGELFAGFTHISRARRCSADRETRGKSLAARAVPSAGVKLDLLIVLRQSIKKALAELEAGFLQVTGPLAARYSAVAWMIEQRAYEVLTLKDATDRAEAVARTGAVPLRRGEGPNADSWLIVHDDVGLILALESAGKTDLKETSSAGWRALNEFTIGLADAVAAYRPSLVVTGRPDRVIRLWEHSKVLCRALAMVGTELRWLDPEHPVLYMASKEDEQLFDRIAQDCERDYWRTIAKMNSGQLQKAANGTYPLGETTLPIFYRQVPKSAAHPAGVAYCDEATPFLLLACKMASEGRDDKAIAAALIKARCPASSQHRRRAENAGETAEVIGNGRVAAAAAVVATWWRFVPVLATGQYTYSQRIPFPVRYLQLIDYGAATYEIRNRERKPLPSDNERRPIEEREDPYFFTDLAFEPITRAIGGETVTGWTAEEEAMIRLCWKHKRPDANVGLSPAPRSSTSRPFDGTRWTEGGDICTLRGRGSTRTTNRYLVWAEAANGRETTTTWGRRGRIVTAANARALHSLIVELAVHYLAHEGIDVSDVVAPDISDSGDSASLESEALVAELRRKIQDAEDEVFGVDEELPSLRRRLGRVNGEEKRLLEKRISRLKHKQEAAEERLPVLRQQLAVALSSLGGADLRPELAAGRLISVLGYLAAERDTDASVEIPAEALPYIAQFFPELRLHSVAGGARVGVEVNFVVSTTFGRRATTLSGELPAAAYRVGNVSVSAARQQALATRFLAGEEVSSLATWAGIRVDQAARQIHEQLRGLVPGKGPRAAVGDAPVKALRKVFAALNSAGGRHDCMKPPRGLSKGYVDTVIKSYVTRRPTSAGKLVDPGWVMAWAGDTHELAWAAVGYVVATARKAPSRGVPANQLLTALGITSRQLLPLVHGSRRSPSTQAYKPVLEIVPWRDGRGKWHTDWSSHPAPAQMRVRARWCEVCEAHSATHVLRVLEVPESVICLRCMTSPGNPDCVYPPEYRYCYSGPRGRGEGGTGTVRVASPLNAAAYKARFQGVGGKAGRERIEIPEEELRQLYVVEGLTQMQVAERFHTSKPTVLRFLRHYGISPRKGGIGPGTTVCRTTFTPVLSEAQCRDLYVDHGLSLREIADRHELSQSRVRRHMLHYGITLRARGRGGLRPSYAQREISMLDRDALERLYCVEGRGSKEVARILGCSASKVTSDLRWHGLPVRTRGQHAQQLPHAARSTSDG